MKGTRSKPDTRKADNKLSVKRKAGASDGASKKPTKKDKSAKDPNKPKRPASAFFVFMEEFRKTFKEKHPNNKSVSVVGKAGGDKWKSLSDAEKAPYVAKAEKRKVEYNKSMQAYNKKQAEGANAADDDEESSDKSKSEVNDDDDEDESGEEDEDDE
ncbi:HMG1/2-like protein [Telopea speciosissima]|uniref:HMG1/2-like protein n=1 Tax=Telopea speciosissima TaxID=54955 RepID=UPI001CC7608F|nr:HMG1/2-like protein [Telopea speciosissima]